MLVLFLVIILLVVINVPVCFAMLGGSVVYMAVNGISFNMLIQKLVMTLGGSYSMIAVPFFMLAGSLMNSGGISKRIFRFCDTLIGHVPGGLGHVNVFASVIFAGMSGSAIADTGGLGAIELKAMHEAGYDDEFSCAITGISSCLGPIIPPSIGFVLYAMMAEESVGKMFAAGIVPGILMAGVMCFIVYLTAKKRHYPVSKKYSAKEKWQAFKEAFFSLMAPVILLSGILIGIFSPTEAAVVCTLYSLILGLCYKEFKIKDLPKVMAQTLRSSGMVMTMVCCCMVFAAVLTYENVPQELANFFMSSIDSPVLTVIAISAITLFAGMIMDVTPASLILTPIFLPVIRSLGISVINFGVVSGILGVMGLTTPPVASILYVLQDYSGVPIMKIAREMVPYWIGLLILVVVLFIFPQLSLWLPNLVFGA